MTSERAQDDRDFHLQRWATGPWKLLRMTRLGFFRHPDCDRRYLHNNLRVPLSRTGGPQLFLNLLDLRGRGLLFGIHGQLLFEFPQGPCEIALSFQHYS